MILTAGCVDCGDYFALRCLVIGAIGGKEDEMKYLMRKDINLININKYLAKEEVRILLVRMIKLIVFSIVSMD